MRLDGSPAAAPQNLQRPNSIADWEFVFSKGRKGAELSARPARTGTPQARAQTATTAVRNHAVVRRPTTTTQMLRQNMYIAVENKLHRILKYKRHRKDITVTY